MLFQDPIHQPFSFRPTEQTHATQQAAMLLHGYLGSPAELRALGDALCQAGVRADAPALPGFGLDIQRIRHVNEGDWLEASGRDWASIADATPETVLIGFSMGGALALNLAAELAPTRLILIEPFQRIPDWRARFLPIASRLITEIRPFEKADFSDPATRGQFDLSGKGLDLDDPAVQAHIRNDATMPITSLQALARIGKASLQAAKRVTCPTLIVQASPVTDGSFGHPDTIVKRLAGPVTVEWVPGDHQLVRDNRPSWQRVRDVVVAFASGDGVPA